MKSFLTGLVCIWIGLGIGQADQIPPLGHGLNLGNFLEAPHEGAWSDGRLLKESDFSTIQAAGFTVVRVPISWAAHVGPGPDFTIDPAFLSRVDWVVSHAEQNHLQAILDYHNDDELMKQPDANGNRFVAIWKQIAEHYQAAPDSILFELLNEPYGKLDASRWNALLARALAVIRETNPTRRVVVGPVQWNGIGALKKLELPENDHHLIVTFHYYEPMQFTHQGASWIEGSMPWLGTTWDGTDKEKQAVLKDFDQADAWGKAHDCPLYMGEFGSYEKGDMASRARWTAFVARTAEAHGFAWTYWEFCSGFGAYDPVTNQWRQPLLEALLSKP